MKVGRDRADDIRRAGIVRSEIGPARRLMFDANQVWDVPQAIQWMQDLARSLTWWIEEPTSPDDVLGHAAIAAALSPIRVATGEHCANAVLFKQFFQAGALHVCQLDACRVAGVNECLATPARRTVRHPACPHAGGVGLCEHVQHLSAFERHRPGRAAGGSGDPIRRRSSPRTFRRPCPHATRALPAAREPRVYTHNSPRIARHTGSPTATCGAETPRDVATTAHLARPDQAPIKPWPTAPCEFPQSVHHPGRFQALAVLLLGLCPVPGADQDAAFTPAFQPHSTSAILSPTM